MLRTNFFNFDDDFFTSFFDVKSNFDLIDNKVDIIDYDDKIEIVVDVPGFTKEDIKIEYEDKYLYFSGQIKSKTDENIKYLHQESKERKFERKVYVKDLIKTDEITATIKDGILTISLPKSEKKKSRKIEIK